MYLLRVFYGDHLASCLRCEVWRADAGLFSGPGCRVRQCMEKEGTLGNRPSQIRSRILDAVCNDHHATLTTVIPAAQKFCCERKLEPLTLSGAWFVERETVEVQARTRPIQTTRIAKFVKDVSVDDQHRTQEPGSAHGTPPDADAVERHLFHSATGKAGWFSAIEQTISRPQGRS